jgi:hypothetical protein
MMSSVALHAGHSEYMLLVLSVGTRQALCLQ